MYCSHQYLSIDPKKVDISNAHKPPKTVAPTNSYAHKPPKTVAPTVLMIEAPTNRPKLWLLQF